MTGIYSVTITDEGKLYIPAEMRRELGDDIVTCRLPPDDDKLYIYSKKSEILRKRYGVKELLGEHTLQINNGFLQLCDEIINVLGERDVILLSIGLVIQVWKASAWNSVPLLPQDYEHIGLPDDAQR